MRSRRSKRYGALRPSDSRPGQAGLDLRSANLDADRAHDAEVRKADNDYAANRDKADATRERAYSVAQEKHITDIQAARRTEQDARDTAARTLDRAQKSADAALDQQLQGIPAAKAIVDDFTQRNATLNTQCEQEKQAILDRLRHG